MKKADLEKKLFEVIRSGDLTSIPKIINGVQRYIKEDVDNRANQAVGKIKKLTTDRDYWKGKITDFGTRVKEAEDKQILAENDLYKAKYELEKAVEFFGYDRDLVDNDPHTVPEFANIRLNGDDDKRKFHILMKYWANMDAELLSKCMRQSYKLGKPHDKEAWLEELKEQNPEAYKKVTSGEWKV